MKIGVVGGGASGMMAAYSAAKCGAEVYLFEKNPFFGMKLNITGKGRCNLTNNCDVPSLVKNTVRNGRFMYGAFSAFDSAAVMAFFESHSVPLKTERGNRVFPVSDNAKDISGALKTALHRLKVNGIFEKVTDIESKNPGFSVKTVKNTYILDKIIIATGGKSYHKTGSTGDGYAFAQKLGHSVTELKPSLVPLYTEGNTAAHLEGLSLKNVSVSIIKDGKPVYSDFGEMLFTDKGISGPMILSASAHLDRKNTFPYDLYIDLKPALDRDKLDKRLLSDFSEGLNRDFSNSLSKLLPAKLIPTVIEKCGIPASKKVNAITKEEREHILGIIKAFPMKITGFYPVEAAIITSGGVSVKEIEPKTMMSKITKNLYFCGEILDVDAYTGGFNLQIAWSSGYVAGVSAAKEEK